MISRYRHLLIALAAVGAVVLACWLAVGRHPSAPTEPLGYVPANAVAVAYARVAPLVHSQVVRSLYPESASLSKLEHQCGFDPTRRLQDLLVFVDEQHGSLGHLGLVARGQLDRSKLAACLQHVVRSEGGSARITTMDGAPALESAKGSSRAAFVGDDAVTVGSARAVEGVLRAARGQAPSAAGNHTLQELWNDVASGRDVSLVAALPDRWQHAAAALVQQRTGVHLGLVKSLALGADVEHGLSLGAVLQTPSAAIASRAVQGLQQRIEAMRARPMVAFSVIGTVLRHLQLAAEGPKIVLTLKLTEQQVSDVLAMIDKGRTARKAAPRAEPPIEPDAVVRRSAAAPAGAPRAGSRSAGQAP